jgi:hypothetical protein
MSTGEPGNRSGRTAESARNASVKSWGSAARRHLRRRRMRVFAATGTVAAAALAAGVTVALHTAPSAPSPAAAPSPLAVVTSALARTSAESYAFRIDSTVRFAGKDMDSDVVSGAFDPRHDLGTEFLTSHSAEQTTRAQVRFIGAHLYTWASPGYGFGKPWDESPLAAAEANGMPPGDVYGFVSDEPVSPGALMVVLRSADATVHASSSPGWTGTTYTFTARLAGGREAVSGTVYVDQQGRVRRLMTITTDEGRGKNLGSTTDRDIAFDDFGAPVRVSAPPASQVKHTSGEPYWGFYF